jgi:cation-transporting ATPase E
MFDILALFLARIATMGMIILSSLVIGFFPIALRNASAITLFSVGVPAALLAVWAHPGPPLREPLGTTILRFVLPVAMLTSVAGLIVFYGALGLQIGHSADGVNGPQRDALLAAVTPAAQSALTAFLVMAGLALIVFVEPPTRWLAVIQQRSEDWRPTILAIVLAIVFVAMAVIEPLRGIFALSAHDLGSTLLVGGTLIVWFFSLWAVWRYRVIERFVGASGAPTTT